MNTEITDIKEFKGWVLYDADCRICVRLAKRVRHLLALRQLELLPLQTPWVRERLEMPETKLLAEMRLLKPDGTIFGGADAFLEICRHYRLGRPIYQLGRIPVVAGLLHAGYHWIARNRNCVNGACKIENAASNKLKHFRKSCSHRREPAPMNHPRDQMARTNIRGYRVIENVPGRRFADYLPLTALPLLAFGFRMQLAPWVFMWAMAFSLYAGCKWLTYREARRRGAIPSRWRALGYLLMWPGMDAMEFLNAKKVPAKPRGTEWAFTLGKTGLGFILLEAITRQVVPMYPVLGGWTGMTGIIFLLHFGLFHLGSLLWRRAGITATPLMRNPLGAKSLADFWGGRWNTAYNEITFQFTYRPLRRLAAPAIATLLVFGLSGLVHELVISLPARADYGLPTAYFLIQGAGVVFERARAGRRLGLGKGVRGWIFTVLVTAAPAYWLFHPPFIKNVILPMLTAIGAT